MPRAPAPKPSVVDAFLANPQLLFQVQQAPQALIDAWKEYGITAEREKTKRSAISAWKEKEICRISGMTQVLRESMEKEFAQRKDVYQQLFVNMERALDAGNIEAVGLLSAQVVEAIRQSPLDKARDILRQINMSAPLQLGAGADEDELEL